MAFCDGEDDRLAVLREAPDAVLAGVAVQDDVSELTHNGAIAFRDAEATLQTVRIDGDGVGVGE